MPLEDTELHFPEQLGAGDILTLEGEINCARPSGSFHRQGPPCHSKILQLHFPEPIEGAMA